MTGTSPLDAVGAYEVLFRGYDPLDIVKWSAYHVADLELYLAVVPIAVAPIVLARLWRRARDGSQEDAAFGAAFLTVNAGMLFVTAAFASTEFGFDRLHDRNVFYLAPLWLIVLGVWLADGLPRPLVATGVGIGLAVLLLVALPFRYIASDVGVDVVPSALWARLQDHLAGEVVTARKLMVSSCSPPSSSWRSSRGGCGGSCPRSCSCPSRARRRSRGTASSTPRRTRCSPARPETVTGWTTASRPAPTSRSSTSVSSACPASALTWHALYLTEFFNRTVERAAYIDDSIPDGLPIRRVDVVLEGASSTSPDSRSSPTTSTPSRGSRSPDSDWDPGRRHTSSCGRSGGQSGRRAHERPGRNDRDCA